MKAIIIVLIIIILVALGFVFLRSDVPEEEQDMSQATTTEEAVVSEAPPTEVSNETGERYAIGGNSSVSYVAQKEFFSKPVEEVVGTTSDVQGEILLDRAARTFSLNAEVNSQTFETGNGARDKDVRTYFTGPIIVSAEDVSVPSFDSAISFAAPLSLTMNGITRTVNFAVEAMVTESDITAIGEAEVTASDFAVDPPSLANVYEVADLVVLRFNLSTN